MSKDTKYTLKKKIYQEDMTILNIYALITKTPTFINETLLHVNYILFLITVIVSDFNINRQVIQ